MTPRLTFSQLSLYLIMRTNDATVVKLTKKKNNVYERKLDIQSPLLDTNPAADTQVPSQPRCDFPR